MVPRAGIEPATPHFSGLNIPSSARRPSSNDALCVNPGKPGYNDGPAEAAVRAKVWMIGWERPSRPPYPRV
jgi:hypothetical protein